MIDYRFRYIKETYLPLPILNEYTMNGMPMHPRWPANWEWTFDFPDLWRALRAELRYQLADGCLRCLRRLGVKVDRTRPEFAPSFEEVVVDTRDLIEAIRAKLVEYQRRQLMEGAMILVGPREFHELKMLDDWRSPILLYAPMTVGYKGQYDREPTYTLFSVPVFFLPDFVGVAVVPDFASLVQQQPRRGW